MRADPKGGQLQHGLKPRGRLYHCHEHDKHNAAGSGKYRNIQPDPYSDRKDERQNTIATDPAVMHDPDFGFGIAACIAPDSMTMAVTAPIAVTIAGRFKAWPTSIAMPPAAPITSPTSGNAQSEEIKSGGRSSGKRYHVTGMRLRRRKADAQSPKGDCLSVLFPSVMRSC